MFDYAGQSAAGAGHRPGGVAVRLELGTAGGGIGAARLASATAVAPVTSKAVVMSGAVSGGTGGTGAVSGTATRSG
ncbi:hypothetical protein ACYQR9_15565 [Methylobacterium sp. CM6241]